MNRVNSQLYSMTKSAGVEDPVQPVAYQHTHWSVVDGVSSLLPTKSLFEVTRVVRNCTEAEDGVNEVDQAELVAKSELDKMSTSAEKEPDLTTSEHCLPLASVLNKDMKNSGMQSRFRIVKIESKGLVKRGRWTCRDFADPPEAKTSDVTETQSAGSSNTTEPVFYVQGAGHAVSQFIFYSEGHPVLESDALPCASKLIIDEIAGSISTSDTGSTLLSMCQPTAADGCSDRVSADSGLKSFEVANSDTGSDGTVGTGLSDRHHDFDRVLWPAVQEDFHTPSLLSLVVDESNESTTAR